MLDHAYVFFFEWKFDRVCKNDRDKIAKTRGDNFLRIWPRNWKSIRRLGFSFSPLYEMLDVFPPFWNPKKEIYSIAGGYGYIRVPVWKLFYPGRPPNTKKITLDEKIIASYLPDAVIWSNRIKTQQMRYVRMYSQNAK